MYKSICVEVYIYTRCQCISTSFHQIPHQLYILPYRPKRPSQPLREVPEADRRD